MNLKNGGGVDGPDDRWPGLADIIREANPHVVLLQELGGWLDHCYTRWGRAERDLGMRIHIDRRSGTRSPTAVAHVRDIAWMAVEDRYSEITTQGFTHVALDVGLDWPLAVISAHLATHSATVAAQEMKLLVQRVYRRAGVGVVGGDINHCPLDVADDPGLWESVPAYNRTARTVNAPGEPWRADVSVADVARHGGLTDVASYLAHLRGDDTLRAATGYAGRVRVDWFLTTPALTPAVVDYRRVANPHSDHDAIVMDLDLTRIDAGQVIEWV